MSDNIVTPVARMAYPSLFVPTAMNDTQEKKFGCVLLFPLDADLSQLKKAALEAAQAKWGDKAAGMLQNKQVRSPFRDQKEKAGKQGFGEGFFITVRNATKPGIVDEHVQPVLDPSQVFGGLLVRASVKPFAYDNSGNKGISFSLQNLMIVKDDGTRWDGRQNAEDAFAAFRSSEGGGAKVSAGADIFG
jgi:hypothetical protein